MTVALYTAHLVRHLPLSRQLSGFLQLLVRGFSGGSRGEVRSIVTTDGGGHVAHRAVTCFYIVSIAQLVVSVVVWEMPIHKF